MNISWLIRQSNKTRLSSTEEGFTLIELMIVVVIIGILAAIAVPVFAKQQRASIEATVVSDTRSNSDSITDGKNGKLYLPTETFMIRKTVTDGNIVGYTVNNERNAACVWASHDFGNGDIVTKKFLTSTGKMGEGNCEDLGNTIVSDGTTTIPTGSTVVGGGTGAPATVAAISAGDGSTILDYTVQSVASNRVCFDVTAKTASATPITWSVKVNTTSQPFRGKTNSSDYSFNDSRYGFDTSTPVADVFTMSGTGDFEKISSTSSKDIDFCVNNLTPAMFQSPANAQMGTVSGGQYYATQNVTITSTEQFYNGWEVTVDLTNLRNTVSGKPSTQQPVSNESTVSITHVSGNIYKLKALATYSTVKEGIVRTVPIGLG